MILQGLLKKTVPKFYHVLWEISYVSQYSTNWACIYTLYEIHFQMSNISHPSYIPVRGFYFVLMSVV